MSSPASTTPEWFIRYHERGFKLYRYPLKQKGPSGRDAKNWTNKFEQHFTPDSNWGVALGVELSPGKFLADVDFDWADGVKLAKRLLPHTGFGFGRAGKFISHAFYTTPSPVALRKFEDVDGQCLVELRGTKKDGTIGFQTMVPPSVHPNGEPVEMRTDGDIAHVPEIERATTLYAIACVFLRHLGVDGLKHDVRLALAGFLLKEGLDDHEVVAIAEAIAECTGNDVSDVRLTVQTTAAKLRGHERVKGRQTLTKAIGDQGAPVLQRVREWLGGGLWIEDGKTGKPIANNQENIRRALDALQAKVSYDAFAERLRLDYDNQSCELDDFRSNRLWLEIESRFGFRPTRDYFDTVLTDIAFSNRFHPVRDYLDGLSWDGVARLDTWLIDHASAKDTDYTRAVSSLPLIAAVQRVMESSGRGVKFDELLVLESRQGQNKSSALRALCPVEAWFSDDLPLNVDSKQLIERTLGKWIVEAGELAGMRRSDIEQLKSTLSRQSDGPVRLAYARRPTERARQFIVIGTTNSNRYLKDGTGNRRFWPLKVSEIDVPAIRAVRDQLWAEALVRVERGDSSRLDPRLYEVAARQQEDRREDDPWEDELTDYLDLQGSNCVQVRTIWSLLSSQASQRNAGHAGRIADIMQRHGFVTKRKTWLRHSKTGVPYQAVCWLKGEVQGDLREALCERRGEDDADA